MVEVSPAFALFDCVTGRHVVVTKTPFVLGSGPQCDWRVEGPGIAAEHCLLQRKGGSWYLLPAFGITSVLLDGLESGGAELSAGEDHTVMLRGHFFALRGGDAAAWAAKLDHREWFIYDSATQQKFGPCAFSQLAGHVQAREDGGDAAVIMCQGLTTMGFYADQALPFLPGAEAPAPADEAPVIDVDYGEFTCPVCWLKFDRGDTMNIAVHASLRGDPILGEAQMQRFQATRFNDRGQAIDAMSIPAPEQACPHCRRKLPPGFLDTPHHIFSIVGAPSSGKSYYLSVLVKTLGTTLFQEFGVTFRDADPVGNVMLNEMKKQLFSAASPEEAALAATELEGAMYETLPRLGRRVKLPKPFVFSLSKPRTPEGDFSLVFYDNAGEHFQPGQNSADSPGTQHIAAAAGIFFLFDPLRNQEFRRRLQGVADPQLDIRAVEDQDILLAESEVRVKTLLGLETRQRIATPLAFIAGKSDTWRTLLGERELEWPVRDGRLDLAAVGRNSQRVRALLLELCPAAVANAEAISSDVMYFAASPLGCSPVAFTDARGGRRIGPDPQRLNPQHAEVPTLWALSRIAPAMVPAVEER